MIKRIRHEKDFISIEEYDEKGKSKFFGNYKTDGNINFYDVKGEKRTYPVVEDIYNDIHAKNAMGLPTTGETLENNIKKITPENIDTILSAYEEKSDGETLIGAIMAERGLSSAKRAELVMYIKDVLIKRAESKGIYTDDINTRMTQKYKL